MLGDRDMGADWKQIRCISREKRGEIMTQTRALHWVVLIVNVTQSRIIWKETPNEKV